MFKWPFVRKNVDALTLEWTLKAAICGEFIGFGVLAIQGRQDWTAWLQTLLGLDAVAAGRLLPLIGLFDVLLALIILVRPARAVVAAAVAWGLLTAVVQPFVGVPFWDVVGHTANWATPLALLMLRGWPKKGADWLD